MLIILLIVLLVLIFLSITIGFEISKNENREMLFIIVMIMPIIISIIILYTAFDEYNEQVDLIKTYKIDDNYVVSTIVYSDIKNIDFGLNDDIGIGKTSEEALKNYKYRYNLIHKNEKELLNKLKGKIDD